MRTHPNLLQRSGSNGYEFSLTDCELKPPPIPREQRPQPRQKSTGEAKESQMTSRSLKRPTSQKAHDAKVNAALKRVEKEKEKAKKSLVSSLRQQRRHLRRSPERQSRMRATHADHLTQPHLSSSPLRNLLFAPPTHNQDHTQTTTQQNKSIDMLMCTLTQQVQGVPREALSTSGRLKTNNLCIRFRQSVKLEKSKVRKRPDGVLSPIKQPCQSAALKDYFQIGEGFASNKPGWSQTSTSESLARSSYHGLCSSRLDKRSRVVGTLARLA